MNHPHDIAHQSESGPAQSAPHWSHRTMWTIGLLAAVVIAVMAFGAYRQPELLLNLVGLRYCG